MNYSWPSERRPADLIIERRGECKQIGNSRASWLAGFSLLLLTSFSCTSEIEFQDEGLLVCTTPSLQTGLTYLRVISLNVFHSFRFLLL
jgi:hypothetical protein